MTPDRVFLSRESLTGGNPVQFHNGSFHSRGASKELQLETWKLLVLAVVQGLTEFLPISSTAHLAVIPRLAHWQDPGLAFDVALHVGTLFAVLLYFAPTWGRILRSLLQRSANRVNGNPESSVSRTLGGLIVLGTIPAMISGVLLHKAAETSLRSLPVMGTMLVVVGLLMWLADHVGKGSKALLSVELSDAFTVGIAQAFAVIPGVSRSGSTIAAGLWRGLERDAATRFSFLLSTPIIAGAALFEGHELWKIGMPPEMRGPVALAILLSGITGYLSIWGMIRYVRARSMMVFVVYRLIAGVAILAIWRIGLA
jgi:undecaprenyl-diphosphatase